MSETKTLVTDIDTLLDGTLDDLADIPEFKPYPAGAHKCVVTFESKKINEHPSIIVHLKAIETLELANKGDEPLAKDATTDVAYMMDNEIGQGQFKELIAKLAPQFPAAKSNREVLAAANAGEFAVVTSQRKAKKEPFTVYTTIQDMQLV